MLIALLGIALAIHPAPWESEREAARD